MALGKVIVFGSTGSIGFPVTLAIARHGHETSAVLRRDSIQSKAKQVEALRAVGVSVIEGTLDATVDELVALLHGSDVVVSAISGACIL